jgi:phosphoribosylanthranilate isomerase
MTDNRSPISVKPRVRVKICGIGTKEDLAAAVNAGADAIGLIVGTTHLSEDQLDIEKARNLSAAAPVFISTVLVSHLTDASGICELAEILGVDTIQAHGTLTALTAQELWRRRGTRRIIRTVHITGEQSVDEAEEASNFADALLLDTRTESRLSVRSGPVHRTGYVRRSLSDTWKPEVRLSTAELT